MITYVKYSLSTTKGETTAPDEFNTPFRLSGGKPVDYNYTGSAVVETVTLTTATTDGVALMWQPVDITKDAAGKHVNIIVKDLAGNVLVEGTNYDIDDSDPKNVKIKNGGVAYIYRVGYRYDNVIVPQNDLPRIKAEMVSIPLVAKARRVAVFYSQIAA